MIQVHFWEEWDCVSLSRLHDELSVIWEVKIEDAGETARRFDWEFFFNEFNHCFFWVVEMQIQKERGRFDEFKHIIWIL